MKLIPLIFLLLALAACEKTLDDPEEIVAQSVAAHGFDQLNGRRISFTFRDKSYELLRDSTEYTYKRSFSDSLGEVTDVLVNSTDFTRFINGKEVPVAEEWANKYSNSVNSVHYFFQLPLGLTDGAAIKKFRGMTTIGGQAYYEVQVTFNEEGGGEDFEDVFLYWFNKETLLIDYLAYSYLTDGGGVRFREAINKQTLNGMVFQDYINYKPEKKSESLANLKTLFEAGKLIELSRIENEAIRID